MEIRVKAGLAAIILAIALAPTARAAEGRDAGYEWAEFNSIDDPARCYDMSGNAINNSPSFTEGCLLYLQDQGITNENGEPRRRADHPGSDTEDDG